VNCAAWSPNGEQIAYSAGPRVAIRDVKTGERLREFPTKSGVCAIAFDPDGHRIIWGDGRGVLDVQDIESGSEMQTTRVHKGAIGLVAVTRDGHEIVSVDRKGMVNVWRPGALDDGRGWVTRSDGSPGQIEYGSPVLTSDRRQVVFTTQNGLYIRDVEDPTRARVLDVNAEQQVVLSPNKAYIAAVGHQKTPKVWDWEAGSEVWKFDSEPEVRSIAFSPDGNYIALCHDQRLLSVWDISKKRKIHTLNAKEYYSYEELIVFSPDSKSLATNENGTIVVYDVQSGIERSRFKAGEWLTHMTFSSDGKRIVSADVSGTIRLSDVASGAVVSRCFLGEVVWAVDLSPDGSRIVSGAGTMVSVWDANTGSRMLSLDAEATIGDVGFSRDLDGKRVVAACLDGTVRIWDSSSGDRMDDAHDWQTRGITHLHNGDLDLAVLFFTNAIEEDPKNVGSYLNRARSYVRQKEMDKAETDLKMAIQLAPEDPATLAAMAELAIWYEVSERLDEARRLYGMLLDASKKAQDKNLWFSYARTVSRGYFRLGDYRQAKEILLMLTAMLPQSSLPAEDLAQTVNALAWLCATCRDAEVRDGGQAVEYAMKACEWTAWKDRTCIDTLAAAYAEVGDFDSAIKWQQNAIRLTDDQRARGSYSLSWQDALDARRAELEAQLKLY